MDTFKDRLAFLWKDEARQAKIAADIDMTIAGFSRIWNEGGLPKSETLKKIKQLKGCSIDWLLTGEGEPFPNTEPPKATATTLWAIQSILTNLSSFRATTSMLPQDTDSLSAMKNPCLPWHSAVTGLKTTLPATPKTCLSFPSKAILWKAS